MKTYFTQRELKDNKANLLQNIDSTFEPETLEETLKDKLSKLFLIENINIQNFDNIIENKHIADFMRAKDVDAEFVKTVIEKF